MISDPSRLQKSQKKLPKNFDLDRKFVHARPPGPGGNFFLVGDREKRTPPFDRAQKVT